MSAGDLSGEPVGASPEARRYAAFLEMSGAPASVGEPELFPEMERVRPGSELAWQSRWFAGHFGREFTAIDGRPVRIVQFGWWNHGAGPDFRDCVVEIGEEVRRGSIELDLDARDWESHGHARNPAYEDVVLHLHLTDSGSGEWFTKTAANREVPQVRLEAEAVPPGAVVVPAARPGRCVQVVRRLSAEALRRVMEDAARYRLERKARRWHRVASVHGEEEAWWQGFAAALGYSRNQLPMTVLSQRLPLRWLQKRLPDAEAVLFGVAGFLDGRAADHGDEATKTYLRGLWESWWRYRAAFAPGEPHAPIEWQGSGTRPANHPQRRVAALASLAASWRRLRPQLTPEAFRVESFTSLLGGLEHPYWTRHWTLTSAPAATPQALLGRSRITDILANVCCPLLLPARPELWKVYAGLPAGQESERLRRAMLRVFGSEEAAAPHVRRLWQQQALLQIHDDFCMQDASDCAACPFPEQAGN